MKRLITVVVLALPGLALAAQPDVGKSLQTVAKAYHYGPPLKVADLEDGRRLFQWEMRHSMVIPRKSTYGEEGVYAAPGVALAPDPAPLPVCVYSVYARWTADKQAWLVTDIRKPNITCV
ncbi:hypothetical protein BH11PSE2_BH11PSE2_21280 [soil metagenome]